MKEWGLLCEDFPRVPKTTEKIKKTTTPRKNIKLPVAKKTSPVKTPRKKITSRQGVEESKSPITSNEAEDHHMSP